jgi:hypothetical protein
MATPVTLQCVRSSVPPDPLDLGRSEIHHTVDVIDDLRALIRALTASMATLPSAIRAE